MIRCLYSSLLRWKESSTRMPLLIRGARQTGKTYLIESFGQHEFENLIVLNFELDPRLKDCFSELLPEKILEKVTLLMNQNVTPGKTLLFLDEIQECPAAILALRYFKEQVPALHVIGAGSLLEFTLNSPDFRMPVGRIEFLYLYPFTFYEFLCALGHQPLADFLKKVSIEQGIPKAVHERLTELLRLYWVTGGMPAVIQAYQQEGDLRRCQQLQANLLNTYKNDFGKYASLANQEYCKKIFEKAPYLVAEQFKYVDVDPDSQSRSLKHALHLLKQAGLIHLVYFSKPNGLPLNASINEKKFKLLFLDVGLVKYASYLDADLLLQKDLLLLNAGQIAEQFVGQELIAYQPYYQPAQLFFWEKNAQATSAEIDYLIHVNSHIVPIEVKAGKSTRLKSLLTFMDHFRSPIGIRISQDYFSWDGKILSLPLYMISEVNRMVQQKIEDK